MKTNKLFAVAMAATALLASCAKNIEGGNTNTDSKERSVYISIDQKKTRTVGDEINNAPVEFTSGYLLFHNGANEISTVITITTAAVTGGYDVATKTVNIGHIKASVASPKGGMLTGIPATSTGVVFIGNAPSTMTAPVIGANVNNFTADLSSQYAVAGDVSKVTLYGKGTLELIGGTGADKDNYKTAFDVKPIGARIEIGKIVGKNSTTGAPLDYKVRGVFIDKYYTSMHVNGGMLGAAVTNGNDAAKYAKDAIGSSYTSALDKIIYDFTATGHVNDWLTTTTQRFAYNLLAPTSFATGTTATMPAIVFKLDVVGIGEVFLTITKFYEKPVTTPKIYINQLEQGCVYQLGQIDFDESNLGPKPYDKPLNVYVDVNLVPWTSKSTGYEFE